MKDLLAIHGGEKTIDKSFPWPIFDENEVNAIAELTKTGEWGNPDSAGIVEEFEKEFAAYCGTKYALSCVNGSVALRLALIASGVYSPTHYAGVTERAVEVEPNTKTLVPSDENSK